jgi:hypothetical protein
VAKAASVPVSGSDDGKKSSLKTSAAAVAYRKKEVVPLDRRPDHARGDDFANGIDVLLAFAAELLRQGRTAM